MNHASPATTAMAAPPARSTARRRHAIGAATATASSTAGSTGAAASILLVNAAPNSRPVATTHPHRPVSAARTPANTVAVIISVRMASVLFEWLTITAMGVTASAMAPTVAAIRPHRRTRVRYTSTTAPTPASTWGIRRVIEWKPKMRTASACTQRENGGLSTETKPTLSNEPYQNACQLWLMLRTAAE